MNVSLGEPWVQGGKLWTTSKQAWKKKSRYWNKVFQVKQLSSPCHVQGRNGKKTKSSPLVPAYFTPACQSIAQCRWIDMLTRSCRGVIHRCCHAPGIPCCPAKQALICSSSSSSSSGSCVLMSKGTVQKKNVPPGFLPWVPLSETAPIVDCSAPAAGLCPLQIKWTNPA